MPKIRGENILYSSQEASQMIFMDTLSKGSDIDLAKDLIEDSDLDSDYEPEEQDIDIHSEEEEECETPQRKR